MRIKVFAEDDAQYTSWISLQKKSCRFRLFHHWLKHGKFLFENKSCGNCHKINGTTAGESYGPDLTHMASRTTLLAGKKKYSFENLKKWIADPQHEKPGANMPDFILSDNEVNAIASYLNQLK